MATIRKTYSNTRPSPLGAHKLGQEHVPLDDSIGGNIATYDVGWRFFKNSFPTIGGGYPYVSTQWSVTATGTSAAAAEATTPGGGLLLTCGSTSTFYSGLQSKATVTPTVLKTYAAYARVQISHATQIGFNIGFGNVQADPTNTDYTDFIGFRKAAASAAVTGTVRGNSGTATSTATLITAVAATEYFLGFSVTLGATAAACSGQWMYGTDANNLTVLPMSTTILTEVVKFLTTPPTDWGFTVFAAGTTGNTPTMTVTAAVAQGDN